MECSITNGRLLDECLQIAGVKTIFFGRHDQLKVTRNPSGLITGIEPIALYRFEQETGVGFATTEHFKGAGETVYVKYRLDGLWWKTRTIDVKAMNVLRAARWAMFYLDYDHNVRLMGEVTPMISTNGNEATPESVFSFAFEGNGDEYPPFAEPYTDFPFDNFPNVGVVPPYRPAEGRIIYNDLLEYVLVNNNLDLLDYN